MANKTSEKPVELISEVKGVGKVLPASMEYYLKITKLKQLTKYSEKELGKLHGVGKKGLSVLKAELKRQGMDFKPSS